MSKGQIIIASLVVAIFGSIMVLYIVAPDQVPSDNREWNMLVGALISQFTIVLSYLFGSSKGSADKNDLLAEKKPNP